MVTQLIFEHAVIIVVGFVFFFIAFLLTWRISLACSRTYPKLPTHDKADWCSRANSTLHALIILPGLIVSLAVTSWDWNTLEPTSSPWAIQFFFCVSVSYFLFDLLVMLVFRIPDWGVYVAHHVIASLPYLIYLFDTACPWGTFPFALYLLVEIATLTLNIQTYLIVTGREDWVLCRNLFYVTYVLWLLSRVALPLYILYVIYAYFLRQRSSSEVGCLVPAVVCSHIIAIFCISVFAFVLSKQLYLRWYPVVIEKIMDGKRLTSSITSEEMLAADSIEVSLSDGLIVSEVPAAISGTGTESSPVRRTKSNPPTVYSPPNDELRRTMSSEEQIDMDRDIAYLDLSNSSLRL